MKRRRIRFGHYDFRLSLTISRRIMIFNMIYCKRSSSSTHTTNSFMSAIITSSITTNTTEESEDTTSSSNDDDIYEEIKNNTNNIEDKSELLPILSSRLSKLNEALYCRKYTYINSKKKKKKTTNEYQIFLFRKR